MSVLSTLREFFQQQSKFRKSCFIFFVLTVLTIIHRMYKKIQARKQKLPPHLYGLPVIGRVLDMIFLNEYILHKILPTHGDIVTYNVLNDQFCEINDIDVLNKLYQKAYDRNDLQQSLFTYYGFECPVVAGNENEKWGLRRKTLMRNLTKLLNK